MSEKIHELIEKYFEGTTSIEEERTLHTYFNSENVASDLKHYQPMFAYFKTNREERLVKEFSVKTPKNRSLFWKIGIAATIFPAVFGWFYVKEQREQQEAELIYQQVKYALELVSVNYNKGTEKMVYLGEFNKNTKKIFKNLE
ncbi:hypothetical protein ACF3OB_10410 [Capnocytophaga canis]|uniref:hypothetical protein n=1 Tax=Capnocytophaga canis TaxID=1848903 RepID=UPI00370DCDB4